MYRLLQYNFEYIGIIFFYKWNNILLIYNNKFCIYYIYDILIITILILILFFLFIY